MEIKNETWTIKKLYLERDVIDPSPPFQRGPVWKRADKKLLIDSILRGYDIPKIYLFGSEGSGYKYAVADGQQRLLSIWGYIDGDFKLGEASDDMPWAKRSFDDLPPNAQDTILDFEIITAIVYDPSKSEIRELFLRLQKGMRLLPPEIRNAIPSQLGDTIRAIASNHRFFNGEKSAFPTSRRKSDDLVAHAFLLELSDGGRDLKALELRLMYQEYATGVDVAKERRVFEILDYLDSMQSAFPRCIKTKWGFVDLYWLVSQQKPKLPSPRVLAGRYVGFEKHRLKFGRVPEQLLELETNREANRELYNYIEAFRIQGGVKGNVRKRNEVLSKALLNEDWQVG